MTQVNRTPSKYFAGALGAALLLAGPAAAQSISGASLLSLAKSSAILGGQPSALAMIEARQSGNTLPVLLPSAPSPASSPVTLASNTFSVRGYMQPAVFSRPAYAEPTGSTPDLFGSKAIKVANTRLDGQWRRVSRVSGPAASGLIRAAYTDRAQQLESVNRWVNHAITYADDIKVYGRPDYWANASESLRRGKGDCEDYAVAKMQILRAMGVPQRDLYLVIVRDLVRRADHAVLAVRTDVGFVILDSNTDQVLPQGQVTDYRPILTFNSQGSWIHGFAAERPRMTLASTGTLTPGAR
jgi:predicted transglutaminase-like cysteine proteinase